MSSIEKDKFERFREYVKDNPLLKATIEVFEEEEEKGKGTGVNLLLERYKTLNSLFKDLDYLIDKAGTFDISKEYIYDGSSGLYFYNGVGVIGYRYTISVEGNLEG